MAAQEQENTDFYDVLGLNRECSTSELKNAYKKLAMKWHPDRCSASGNSKHVEAAKRKFQDIQQAYSVLSDTNKRFLYDVGVYDCCDDEDEIGMGDFLNEMVELLCQNNKQTDNRNTSFEEFQELFEQIFEKESNPSWSSSTYASCQISSNNPTFTSCSKKTYSDVSSGSLMFEDSRVEFYENVNFSGEKIKVRCTGRTNRRDGRKQKISSDHDVSSSECSTVSA